MKITVKDHPGFKIMGKRWTVSSRNGENFKVIPTYWEGMMQDGSFRKLHASAPAEGDFHGAVLGVCFDTNATRQTFEYMIASELTEDMELPEDWETAEFSPARYAVFANQGSPLPQAIQATFKYIYETWFPENPYLPATGPELEVYLEDDAFEIWIPVQQK